MDRRWGHDFINFWKITRLYFSEHFSNWNDYTGKQKYKLNKL